MPGGARGIERVRRKVALAKRTPSSPYACMSPKSLVADAAHYILTRPAEECSGNFFLDDEVLLEACVRDFAQYDVQVFLCRGLAGMLPADNMTKRTAS
jgi:citronellol/citronellal dehydrogenase